MKKVLITLSVLIVSVLSSAQSLQHPTIWITQSERAGLLENIEKYDWAQSIVDQLHQQVDSVLEIHHSNPSAFLSSIPVFASDDQSNKEFHATPYADAHTKILSYAKRSGLLYYITQDDKYAQFAADILWAYIEELAPRTPAKTSICGYMFYDARTTYAPFAIAYDFIYDYVKNSDVMVYSGSDNKSTTFDNEMAQKAVSNMVGNVLQEYGEPDRHGRFVSNHPILTATGALYGILCIEDDTERERLFNVFWEEGTAHQNSFKNTILAMFSDQGIWPESTSYSFMPNITQILNIVDRIKPEMNVAQEYIHILEGNMIFDFLRHPNRSFVRYGDSKRYKDFTQTLYIYTLDLALRKGYKELSDKAELALAMSLPSGYDPTLTFSTFDNYEGLELLWGHDISFDQKGDIDFNKPTVLVEHAGVALQRNAVEENNTDYGLCGIIGGAHYVHSHLTGISMELYGAGYIMAANSGLPKTVPERRIPLHEHYYRLYAAHNTVVVNGSSHGLDEGSWKGNAHVWQNKTVNLACEPKHLEDPISDEFSFAIQYLNDTVNKCKQERTLSILRTSDSTGYYVDIFRSKSEDPNGFHDYIYHNIGDNTTMMNGKNKLIKTKATDRYQNDIGDKVHSPGWKYFEDTESTKPLDNSVKLCFDLEYNKRSMHMFIPEGVDREYTLAQAPPTREALNGYIKKPTQVVVIRQAGQAWEQPYMVVLEPSVTTKSSVQDVEHLYSGKAIVGLKVNSLFGEKSVCDYIICNDDTKEYHNAKLDLHFKGRYAVVRVTKQGDEHQIKLYIGEGDTLIFGKYSVTADANKRIFKQF